MKYFSRTFILFLFASLSFSLSAQTLREKIEKSYTELANDPSVRNGIVGLTVMDAESGEVLFAGNEHIGLAPASTLKTITAAAAYSILGSNFTYDTDLSYAGEIDASGTLHGDIILKGSGDPTLGSHRYSQSKADMLLQRWVDAIKNKGIKQIQGRIIGDDLLFNGYQAPGGWPWVDLGNYYGAGISSLNWRENTFNVILLAGTKVGEATNLLRTEPDISYLTIINEVKTGKPGSGDQVYAYSAPYSSVIYLRGTYAIDLNKKINISLPDAAYDLAFSLKRGLEGQGIPVNKEATTSFLLSHSDSQLPVQTYLLDRYTSPDLNQIVYWFNRNSVNLYGEVLLRTIALNENLDPSTEDVCRWEEKYWETKLGIQSGELRIKDGSGLSPETRVTTLAMTKIMRLAKTQPWFGGFYESLPTINGMKMKSGTIGGVLGYTGYHTTATGKSVVFSCLVNNYTGSAPSMRQKMFKMLNSLK